MTITNDIGGWVYVLHFAQPLGNAANPRAQARHYLGWTHDLSVRLAQHALGRGAAITRAAVAQGITWSVFYRAGTPALERWFKVRYKNTPALCPICQGAHQRTNRAGFVPLDQCALPLVIAELVDFPAPPTRGMDWMEISQLRRWRAARADPGGQAGFAPR